MSDNTSLGDRMKSYEEAVGPTLLRRTPVIIRVDGKAFHTLTRMITTEIDPSTETHFSEKFHSVMMSTALSLVEKVQNCVFAYTQSDEISLLLCDWATHETQQWFGGKTQKIVSVSAAMASVYFNFHWQRIFGWIASAQELAMFDSRAYNIPREDVDNYFLWRQRDAIRNSVNFIARKYLSHKSLHGLNSQQIKDKLLNEKGVDWNKYPLWEQRGACIYTHPGFFADETIPLFSEDREYITDRMNVDQSVSYGDSRINNPDNIDLTFENNLTLENKNE